MVSPDDPSLTPLLLTLPSLTPSLALEVLPLGLTLHRLFVQADAKAYTDKVTPINLTQHWGFNLDASLQDGQSVKDHTLTIRSSNTLELAPDANSAGSLAPVAGTHHAHAEKATRSIGERFPAQGYDEFYLLDKRDAPAAPVRVPAASLTGAGDLVRAALEDNGEPDVELASAKSGLKLRFFSNQSGVQFYSNNFASPDKTARKKIHGGSGAVGDGYEPGSAAFLEFHEPLAAWLHPATVGRTGNDTLLAPDEVYNNYLSKGQHAEVCQEGEGHHGKMAERSKACDSSESLPASAGLLIWVSRRGFKSHSCHFFKVYVLTLDDILMADDNDLPLEDNGWGRCLDTFDAMSLNPPDVTVPAVLPATTYTPPRRACMSDMPFDILVLIFKQLHQLSRRSLFLLQDSDWDEWDDYAAFDPLRAFPAAPAAVSPAWRAAMASVSAFWTRVVVLVDDPPTPSRALADALEWSANRPLDVRVCRRVDAYDDASDPRERARVCAALALLTPHMHRWRSFSVDVLHAASLPRPYADLVGRAPLLISLLLDSVDGRAPDPEPDAPSHTDRMLYTPALRFLWLDGNTLRDAYVRPERAGALVRVMRLTVSQYRRDGVPFSVRALVYFLYALPALQSVKLHDLALDVCGSGAPLLDYQLNRLSCDRLAAPVLAEFWRLIDGYSPNHLSLKRCTFEPASMDLSSTMCLSLSDIDGDQDLAGLLDRWEGVISRFRRCTTGSDGDAA
ncbi:predicted protein [Postia placenta Mad-698-R]|nr:predicted protein [Postia placenta Mad-698-R]